MAKNIAIDWAAPLREEVLDESATSDIDWGAPLREQAEFDAQFRQQPEEEEPGVTAGDVGVSLMQGFAGVAGGVGSMVEYGGQQMGIDWMADLGTSARRGAEEASEWWGQRYSEGARAAQQKEWATTGEDAAWKDPGAWALGVSGSAPYLLTSVIPGGALAKIGASAKSIAAASGVTAGVQVGGEAHKSIANEIDGYSEEQMMQIPGVQQAVEAGANLEDVRMYLIQEATKYATPAATAIGVGSGIIGGPIEAALISRTGAMGAKPVMSRVGAGALTEGTQETVESGVAETMVPNIAMGRPATEGVAEAAVSGALLGAGTGGTLGLAPGGPAQQEPGTPERTPTSEIDLDQPTAETPVLPDEPAPEPTAYLDRQLELLDKGTRRAVLATPGSELGEVDAAKYDVVEVAPDTQIVVNKGDDATVNEITDAFASDDNATIQRVLGDALGYGTVGKSPTGEVLTVRNADGEIVYDAVFDGSDDAISAANASVTALGDGASVEVRSVQDAILDRETAYYNERQPEKPVEPQTPEQPVVQPDQLTEPVAEQAPVPTTQEETAPATDEVKEEVAAPAVPPSPFSLTPVPSDENPAMQTVAESYTSTVNKATNIPRGEQIEKKAQLADDLISTMVAYYKDLKAEGYRVAGFNKLFRPVLGNVTLTNLLDGNYTSVTDRAKKKIGVSLTKEMENVVSETDLGPGRKSGQWSGKLTNKKFDKFLMNVKTFIDESSAGRQGKRAAPPTEKAKQARETSAKRQEQQGKPLIQEEQVEEKAKKPAKAEKVEEKAKKAEPEPEVKKAPPPSKAKPLKSIMLSVDVVVEETGKTEPMPMSAEEVFDYENERIGRLKQLVGCLLG